MNLDYLDASSSENCCVVFAASCCELSSRFTIGIPQSSFVGITSTSPHNLIKYPSKYQTNSSVEHSSGNPDIKSGNQLTCSMAICILAVTQSEQIIRLHLGQQEAAPMRI